MNAVDNLSTARIIPRQLTLDNFVELFTNPLTPFGIWIWNTWKVAIVAAHGNVTLAALVAFAFSRLHFRGRRVWTNRLPSRVRRCALGLQLFVSSDYSARWGNLSAAALIGAAPIVLTFLFAQRQIIGGLTRGAVKG